MQWMANLLIRHPGRVMSVILLGCLLAALGVSRLQVDDVPRNLFTTDDDAYAKLEQVYRDFGSEDNDCLLVVQADDVFAPEAVAVLRALVARLAAADGVVSVLSLTQSLEIQPGQIPRPLLPPPGASPAAYIQARRAALGNPLIAGLMVSRDAQATLVVARIADERTRITELSPVIDSIRAAIASATKNSDVKVLVTGVPTIRVEIFEMIPREQARFMSAGALVGIVVGLLVFRRPAAMGIIVLAALMGAFWSLGALGLVGEEINVMNNIMPTLVLVVGFTDAMHLLYDIRASHGVGRDGRSAAHWAIRHLGPACVLTSVTTAIGFGSLALTSVPIIRRLGLACGAGVALTLFAVLLVLPLLCTTRVYKKVQRQQSSPLARRFKPVADKLIRWITRYPGWVSIAGVVVTGVCLERALHLKADSRLTESVPADSESVEGVCVCDEKFGGVTVAMALVEWDEGLTVSSPVVVSALAEIEAAFESEPEFRHPLSILSIARQFSGGEDSPEVLKSLLPVLPADVRNRLVRGDRRSALVTARLTDQGTAAYEPVIRRIGMALRRIAGTHEGLHLHLTGTPVLAVRQLNRMIRDLAASLGIAALVIFGVMTLALKSIRLGLLTVLPNMFPLAVTAAFIQLSYGYLQLASVIVFSICLGVAVDDTIHFVMRFRRELAVDGNVEAALARTFAAVGKVMLATSAVLIGGFGVVLFSAMPAMTLFALLTCIALVAALVGDLVILPALLALFVGRDSVPREPA